MSFYAELKRRNVIRVGAAYAVAAWLLIQVADTTFPLFGFDQAPAKERIGEVTHFGTLELQYVFIVGSRTIFADDFAPTAGIR